MADQKFIFVGDRGSIGPDAFTFGDTVELDPGFARQQVDNDFPIVPAELLTVGFTRQSALVALDKFRHGKAEAISVTPKQEKK